MAALCLILLALTAGLVPDEAWAAKKAAPKPAAGKFITVEAEGYAPIVDGAKNKARDQVLLRLQALYSDCLIFRLIF